MNVMPFRVRAILILPVVLMSIISFKYSEPEKSVESPKHLTPEPETILWTHKFDGQLWAPLAFHNGALYFGSDSGVFYSFDVETQSIRWQFVTGDIIRSEADISGGIVSFASDDGFLYALDVDKGKERWRFDLGTANIARRLPATEAPYDYDYLHSAPEYHDGHLFIGSADSNLYAIDHVTGVERWRFQTTHKIRSTPAVDNNTVYVGSWDGHVYALDRASGEEKWRFDTEGIVQGSPALGAGKVFIGSRGTKVLALNNQTGDKEWEHVHEDGSWVESSPIFSDGSVYIGSSDALKLSAFDALTGNVKWEFKTGGWSWGRPVVSNGVIYIGGISASPYYFEGVELEAGFYAVDQQTGNKIWSMATESVDEYITGGVFSASIIVDGTIYVAGIDGTLYALAE